MVRRETLPPEAALLAGEPVAPPHLEAPLPVAFVAPEVLRGDAALPVPVGLALLRRGLGAPREGAEPLPLRVVQIGGQPGAVVEPGTATAAEAPLSGSYLRLPRQEWTTAPLTRALYASGGGTEAAVVSADETPGAPFAVDRHEEGATATGTRNRVHNRLYYGAMRKQGWAPSTQKKGKKS
jgi:hypothetical protein